MENTRATASPLLRLVCREYQQKTKKQSCNAVVTAKGNYLLPVFLRLLKFTARSGSGSWLVVVAGRELRSSNPEKKPDGFLPCVTFAPDSFCTVRKQSGAVHCSMAELATLCNAEHGRVRLPIGHASLARYQCHIYIYESFDCTCTTHTLGFGPNL